MANLDITLGYSIHPHPHMEYIIGVITSGTRVIIDVMTSGTRVIIPKGVASLHGYYIPCVDEVYCNFFVA